jgi:hypothetical protein
MPSESQHEPVRVGRRHGHLPTRQSEPPRQLVGDPRSIGARQHRRDASTRLRRQRVGNLWESVPDHRSRVAETEVDVGVPVDVGEPGALRGVEHQRERAGPPRHPRHRHPAEQGAGPGRGGGRLRMELDERGFLALLQEREALSVDHGHSSTINPDAAASQVIRV